MTSSKSAALRSMPAGRAALFEPCPTCGQPRFLHDIQPTYNKSLVMREESTLASRYTKEENLIIIPPNAVERFQQEMRMNVGIVMAVGRGLILPSGRRESVDIKPHQRVIFGTFAGQDVKLPADLKRRDGSEIEVFMIYTKDIHFPIPDRG